jgi:hypothetical protein
MASVIYLCEGCGDRLQPSDEVRAIYRELADVIGDEEVPKPRWAYTHLGHEPQSTAYRIIGRGLLSDLERERRAKGTADVDPQAAEGEELP